MMSHQLRGPQAALERRRGPTERGFTLTELMAVVVIVGILAGVAIAATRRYIESSRTTEAAGVIQAIRAAQEAYRAETRRYMDVSAGDLESYYPGAPSQDPRRFFLTYPPDVPGAGSLDERWRTLDPQVDRLVRFGYGCVAGDLGDAMPQLSTTGQPDFPAATGPWYVIQAGGNPASSGPRTWVVATSLSPELYVEAN